MAYFKVLPWFRLDEQKQHNGSYRDLTPELPCMNQSANHYTWTFYD